MTQNSQPFCQDTEALLQGCPCDQFVFPPPISIAAGLDSLPRQVAGFPEYRQALLAALAQQPALSQWRARQDDDLGVMLLEMWAYIGDVVSFYDQAIANEAYLRTAQQFTSLQRLTQILGYVPRPAVAAMVDLAVQVTGRQPVQLTAGTAFRSAAFDAEPPQVFELLTPRTVHPLNNRWNLVRSRPTNLGPTSASDPDEVEVTALLLQQASRIAVGESLLVQAGNTAVGVTVEQVNDVTGEDGQAYREVQFTDPINLPAAVKPEAVQLSRPTLSAALWTLTDESAIAGNTVLLESFYRAIRPRQWVLIENDSGQRWRQVQRAGDRAISLAAPGPTIVTLEGEAEEGEDLAFGIEPPELSVFTTQLTLTQTVGLSGDAAAFTVRYGLTSVGTVTAPLSLTVSAAEPLAIANPRTLPSITTAPTWTPPQRFLLEDANQRGVTVQGRLDTSSGQVIPDDGEDWQPPLTAPIKVFGNVVTAVRGETVTGEILGSGNAAIANQTFELKKKPLTYVAAPTTTDDRGVASSLTVYVNGVQWREVPTFFRAEPNDPVYILRPTEDGGTAVIFGDGIRGLRLPTGQDNVLANYRFGAGAASPPAGGITQLAKPVPGISTVRNPVAAYGGAAAESTSELRQYAPKSTLTLGRIVSLPDMAAVAARVPGVRSVAVDWQWSGRRQRRLARIWYIGATGLEATLLKTLRQRSAPGVLFDVDAAVGIPVTLAIDVEISDRYVPADVLAAIETQLLAPETGRLVPERIGIGQPLYRSQLLAIVEGVPGTVAVRRLEWQGAAFTQFAKQPQAGQYFDFEAGELRLNPAEVKRG
ncbi:hypothetical protein [Halomicronema sp. CCY15110]|uniref:hypothetical protein n=1 Tax=Halomicronema sp. CCY15110 TaxID=2767773 RepID=UPI0019527794|nr:hypothetical protein [Halomicronema sp. CCY15110]